MTDVESRVDTSRVTGMPAPLAGWAVFVATMVIWVTAVVVAAPRTTNPLDPEDVLWASSFLVLAALGRFVVARRRRDVFGWLLLVGPLAIGIGVLGADYAGRVLEGADWPGAVWFALVGNVGFALGAGAIALAMYRFPDGRPVSRGWQVAELVTVVGATVAAIGALTTPVIVDEAGILVNPLIGDRFATTAAAFKRVSVLLLVGGLLSLGSIVARYRRGGTQVRAQLRWVLYPVVLGFAVASVFAAVELLTETELGDGAGIVTTLILTLGVPLGIVAAITRARLYEIDRIVSRTVVYGLVTAVLVGLYGLVAVVPAALFKLESDLLVAGATLVAAAAFGPMRRRVQEAVDRHFNRSRYDAGLVVERFGARLRDQVDLADVAADLRGAVADTVQPSHVSLWLREERR